MTKEQQKELQDLLTVELLSEVLGREVKEFWTPSKQNSLLSNEIAYIYGGRNKKKLLNIDTLCRKMYKKLKEMEYVVTTYHHLDTVAIILHHSGKEVYSTPVMTVLTELEAVIKAVQWGIKQNKGDKDVI